MHRPSLNPDVLACLKELELYQYDEYLSFGIRYYIYTPYHFEHIYVAFYEGIDSWLVANDQDDEEIENNTFFPFTTVSELVQRIASFDYSTAVALHRQNMLALLTQP